MPLKSNPTKLVLVTAPTEPPGSEGLDPNNTDEESDGDDEVVNPIQEGATVATTTTTMSKARAKPEVETRGLKGNKEEEAVPVQGQEKGGHGQPPASLPSLRTIALQRRRHQYFTLFIMFKVQIFFALMSVISKPVFKYVPPFGVALWRMVLSTPLLFLAAYREGSLPNFHLKDVPDLALLGLTGVALAQSTVFLANQVAGPQIVSIMQPTGPVYAALFATALKLERMTWVKFFGILLSIAGALVILRPDTMRFGTGTGTGVIVMVSNCMCYALFLVLLKRKMRTHPHPIALTAHATLWGFIFMAIVGLPSGLATFDLAATPVKAWGIIMYCAFGISFYASLWQTWAVKQTSATLPALFSSLSPFLTRALAYWLLNDRDVGAFTQFIGLALNLLGLFLVIYSRAMYEQPSAPVKAVDSTAATPATPSDIQAKVMVEDAAGGRPPLGLTVTPQVSWLGEELHDTSISPPRRPSMGSDDMDKSSSTTVLH